MQRRRFLDFLTSKVNCSNLSKLIDNDLRKDVLSLLSNVPINIDTLYAELDIPLPIIYTIILYINFYIA